MDRNMSSRRHCDIAEPKSKSGMDAEGMQHNPAGSSSLESAPSSARTLEEHHAAPQCNSDTSATYERALACVPPAKTSAHERLINKGPQIFHNESDFSQTLNPYPCPFPAPQDS